MRTTSLRARREIVQRMQACALAANEMLCDERLSAGSAGHPTADEIAERMLVISTSEFRERLAFEAALSAALKIAPR